MLRSWLLLAVLATACVAQTAKVPERRVEGSSVTSQRDPKVHITLPKNGQYVGADRWILYGVADCEIHVFVEGSSDSKQVQRMYWIQFEQYVPEKPDLHHSYDSPRHLELGGMDFYVDTWVRSNDEPMKTGSDREHVQRLIATGWKMPPEGMMYTRLVHLLDKERRKELMIIYGERLDPWKLTAAELAKNGKAHEHWPEVEKGMLERLQDKIDIKDLEEAKR